MPRKFNGTIDELKNKVKDIPGKWTFQSGKHVFRSADGGIINWWESNKTIQVQGNSDGISSIEVALNVDSNQGEATSDLQSQIFIVHGHDTETRDQLELALHRLGLKPFILMNSSGEGQTIIEALEGRIGKDFTSDFGIVLMTPDDMGFAIEKGEESKEPRARQNVVLETGMLLSSLTRNRMAICVKGHLELPSDLEGIIRFHYNEHIREIMNKLCRRLQEAGFELNSEQIMQASQ